MPDQDPLNMQLTQAPMQPTGGAVGSVLGMIANYHAAKENQASRDIEKMNAAMQAGFHPDPKAYAKAWKNAGVPLISGKDAQALVQNPPANGGAPKGQPEVKDPVDVKDPHADTYDPKKIASITDVKARQVKETELQVDGVIRQAVTNAHLKGANQQQVLEQTQKMMALKNKAIGGDPVALGTLYQLGDIKMDIPSAVYNGMSDKQKAGVAGVMAGMETDEQKAQKIATAASTQVSEGHFTNLEDATKYATAVINGTPVPPELHGAEIAHPLEEMGKAMGAIDIGAQMGYTGDQLASFATRFGKVGMAALPTGLQSIYQEKVKVAKQEANAATTEAGAASTNAKTGRERTEGFNRLGSDGKPQHIQGELESAMTEQEVQKREQDVQFAKINAVMTSTADKEFLAGFAQTMVNYRTKGNVPESVVDDYMDELVERSGGAVSKEEVKHWFKPNTTKSDYTWPTTGAQPANTTTGAPGAP